MKKIKLFDSFAGIGALHKSLKRLNIPVELVGLSEVDIDAIISYGAIHCENVDEFVYPTKEEMQKYLIDRNIGYNFKEEKSTIKGLKLDKLQKVYKYSLLLNNYGDISIVESNNLPNFDLFNFSFPCTDLSVAGKQQGMKDENGNLTRSGLYTYGINIIKSKKPSYIMIENVKNLIGKKFINDFYDIINELSEIGYNCYYSKKKNGSPMCLNAKDYGVPQNRERIFVICIRKDIDKGNFMFPEGFDNGIRLKDILEEQVNEKYYISQEKTEKLLEQLRDKHSLLLDMCQAKREGSPREYTDYAPTLSARDYKEPRLINQEVDIDTGACNKNRNAVYEVRACLSPDRVEKRQKGRRFKGDGEPSFTINTQDRHGILINSGELKVKEDDISSCLDANYWKGLDNHAQRTGVIEAEQNEIKVVGRLETIKGHDLLKRVYDTSGISPTLDSCSGGNRQPKIVEDFYSNRDIREYKDYSPTLRADRQGLKVVGELQYRIRKLTPRECWRLMGFEDTDFNKAKDVKISDSQLYKQAGNSIVVDVLYYIFKNLLSEYIVEKQ